MPLDIEPLRKGCSLSKHLNKIRSDADPNRCYITARKHGEKEGNMTLPKDHDFLTCEHKDIQMAGHIIEKSAYGMINEFKESINK